MIYVILAIGIFFLTFLIHECIHYIVAKSFGHKPRFIWIPSKEKNTIGFFGLLPGVRTEYNNLSELKWINLSPIPFTFMGFVLFYVILFYDYWSNVEWNSRSFIILGVTIIFSFLTTYEACGCDIEGYYTKLKR